LERFGLPVDNIDGAATSIPWWQGELHAEGDVPREVSYMATTKVERASVGFGIGRQNGSIILEVRPHHDTISVLRGVQVGFELLNGITPGQAKKVLDVLNENVIGVLVTAACDDKTEAASG
jgi:hypothetical protein